MTFSINSTVSKILSGFVGFVLAASPLWLAGCGGAETPENWLDRVPVQGTVTLEGQPVEGAVVTLHSENPDQPGATGSTDASGQFELTTYESNDGAVPGEYLVTITKVTYPKQNNASIDDASYDPNAKPAAPVYEIPQKYSQPQSSGLTVTIQAEGENAPTFALQK